MASPSFLSIGAIALEVHITDHARRRTDGSKRSKCRLPDSVIESVVRNEKGQVFYDEDTETYHVIYNRTVICGEWHGEGHFAVVTVYRVEHPQSVMKRRRDEGRYVPASLTG